MTARAAVCCVSTYNQLHYALTLARSIRERWSEQPAIFILLVDHGDLPRPGFDELGDIRFLSLAELAIPEVNWLTLKYNAFELCCACKPFLVRHVLGMGFGIVWYLDTDLLFLGDPSGMRGLAMRHDFVVTPHIFSPLPAESAWLRPTMGHLSGAGVLNAGMFTTRGGEAALRFLGQWGEMNLAPAACLPEVGNHQEQHAFNWIAAFAEDVHFCRDRGTNVAYWNLHERPLRWARLDGGAADQWLLDGKPISSFHFSGLRWEERRLSHHDHRHHLSLNANIHALAAHYDAQLESAGRSRYAEFGYGFARLGPLELCDEVRHYLKLLEAREKPAVEADPAAAATALADHLFSLPGSRSLLPKPLEDIRARRPPLRALDGEETLFPRGFLNWCLRFLEPEYGPRLPLFQSSLLAVHQHERANLCRRCAGFLPEEPAAWILDALVHRRQELKARLLARRADLALPTPLDVLIDRIESGRHLVLAFNPVLALRLIMHAWPRLFRGVPPPGSGDPAAFRTAVAKILAEHFLWPAAHQDFLARLDPEASLARILALIRRHPHLLARARREGLSRPLLADFAHLVPGHGEVDACDLALVDWHLFPGAPKRGGAPPAGRGLLGMVSRGIRSASLVLGSGALPTPRLPPRPPPGPEDAAPGGGDAVDPLRRRLLPLLADEENPERWQGYLDWWAEKNAGAPAAPWSPEAAREALAPLVAAGDWQGLGAIFPALAPEPRGVNLFGYFRSPIGLGQMSRGVAAALAAGGRPCRKIVLTNLTMSRSLRLEDLYPNFGHHFPRNLVVTYPHINYDLAEIFPRCFFRQRETIGYVAWEQRDLHPEWCRRLDRYDRLLALSRFTAESVARATGRDCQALPCVVEVDVEGARSFRRAHFGLPEDAFVAGIVFDATSSVQRKNPMAAARALVRAFRGRRDVTVLLKVNGGQRPQYRRAVAELTSLLSSSGIGFRLITQVLSRQEVDGLMAQLDLYVSLHRSEGFGYSIAEAMWLGVPVVATAYSGNMDFMHEGNSFPVRFRETVLRQSEGPFQPGTVWAEPDPEHAAALCDLVYCDRAGARAKSARAVQDIRGIVSVEAVAGRLRTLLA